MRNILISILMFSLAILVGCGNAETSEKNKVDAGRESETAKSDTRAADEAAIRKLHKDYCKAETERDLDAKMKLYSKEAVIMAPGEESIKGKDAVRAKHEEWWKGTKYDCSNEVAEINISDDWAVAWGTYSGTVTEADGKKKEVKGRFMGLLRRESDGWKISRGINNLY